MNNVIHIITNGNDSQVPYMKRMFESFKVWNDVQCQFLNVAITDKLSNSRKRSLQEKGIQIVQLPSKVASELNNKIGSNQHPLGKIGKPFLLRYYLNSIKDNDFCLYCDPDMLLLTELSTLLATYSCNRVTVSQSLLPTAGHVCSDRLYKPVRAGALPAIKLPHDQAEVCTGFFLARRDSLMALLDGWIHFMLSEPFNSYKDTNNYGFAWHDQDFFRCYHTLNSPLPLNILSPTEIIITNPPAYLLYNFRLNSESVRDVIAEIPPQTKPPIMVHFAGGSHEHYPEIANLYVQSDDV